MPTAVAEFSWFTANLAWARGLLMALAMASVNWALWGGWLSVCVVACGDPDSPSPMPDDGGASGAAGDEEGRPASDDGRGGGDGALPALPALAFQIDARSDLVGAYQDCRQLPGPGDAEAPAGPWLVALRENEERQLEGAIVSRDPNVPAWHRPNAWPLLLEPKGDHYAIGENAPVPILDYHFGAAAVPGVCLSSGTRFTPIDDDEDGVADRLELRGTLAAQVVSSDFAYECPDGGGIPFETTALIPGRIELRPAGDALRPRLELDGGLLEEGTAVLEVDGESVNATALVTGGFIHAFEATESVAPGSSVRWRVTEPTWVGAAPKSAVVDGEIPPMTFLEAGDFEAVAQGRLPGDGEVASSFTCCSLSEVELTFPPISGARSLNLPIEGGTELFHLPARQGMNRLTFVGFSTGGYSYGSPWVEVARVGSPADTYQVYVAERPRAEHRLSHELADCAAYAAICNYLESHSEPERTLAPLEKYSIELPEGTGDVLVRLRNMGITDGCGSEQLWLDDFRLE